MMKLRKTFLMKTLMMKSKQCPRPLSRQKWYEPSRSCKPHTLTMSTKCQGSGLGKKCKRKIDFLIDLASFALVPENTEPINYEPQTFNKARNHPNLES